MCVTVLSRAVSAAQDGQSSFFLFVLWLLKLHTLIILGLPFSWNKAHTVQVQTIAGCSWKCKSLTSSPNTCRCLDLGYQGSDKAGKGLLVMKEAEPLEESLPPVTLTTYKCPGPRACLIWKICWHCWHGVSYSQEPSYFNPLRSANLLAKSIVTIAHIVSIPTSVLPGLWIYPYFTDFEINTELRMDAGSYSYF